MANLLRIASIPELDAPAGLLQRFDQDIAGVVDPRPTAGIKAQVDFSVAADLLDIALLGGANGEGAPTDLMVEESTGVHHRVTVSTL